MESRLSLRGDVIIERRDSATGKVLDREELKNLIVNVGKEKVAKLIGNTESGLNAFGYIAIGEGTTTPTVTDTVLETERVRNYADGGGSYEANYKCIFEKTFTFGSGVSYSITEAGVFNDATVGDMLDRFTFTVKAVDSDTDLYVKVTITVA